jgi:hypothetical protein
MKSSVAKLKSRYCHLIVYYLFILESLILFIFLVLVKNLSHVHCMLVSYTKMLRLEAKNNLIYKIYLKGNVLSFSIKDLDSFLRKTFSQCKLRSPNASRMLTIKSVTHKCIKVIYTSHLNTQSPQNLESIS